MMTRTVIRSSQSVKVGSFACKRLIECSTYSAARTVCLARNEVHMRAIALPMNTRATDGHIDVGRRLVGLQERYSG